MQNYKGLKQILLRCARGAAYEFIDPIENSLICMKWNEYYGADRRHKREYLRILTKKLSFLPIIPYIKWWNFWNFQIFWAATRLYEGCISAAEEGVKEYGYTLSLPSLCRAYAEPMPSLCRAYAEPMPSLCRAYAEPAEPLKRLSKNCQTKVHFQFKKNYASKFHALQRLQRVRLNVQQ